MKKVRKVYVKNVDTVSGLIIVKFPWSIVDRSRTWAIGCCGVVVYIDIGY